MIIQSCDAVVEEWKLISRNAAGCVRDVPCMTCGLQKRRAATTLEIWGFTPPDLKNYISTLP